jgi:hypothetical protein
MDPGQDAGGESLLLQYSDQGDAMDEARGADESSGGEIVECMHRKMY